MGIFSHHNQRAFKKFKDFESEVSRQTPELNSAFSREREAATYPAISQVYKEASLDAKGFLLVPTPALAKEHPKVLREVLDLLDKHKVPGGELFAPNVEEHGLTRSMGLVMPYIFAVKPVALRVAADLEGRGMGTTPSGAGGAETGSSPLSPSGAGGIAGPAQDRNLAGSSAGPTGAGDSGTPLGADNNDSHVGSSLAAGAGGAGLVGGAGLLAKKAGLADHQSNNQPNSSNNSPGGTMPTGVFNKPSSYQQSGPGTGAVAGVLPNVHHPTGPSASSPRGQGSYGQSGTSSSIPTTGGGAQPPRPLPGMNQSQPSSNASPPFFNNSGGYQDQDRGMGMGLPLAAGAAGAAGLAAAHHHHQSQDRSGIPEQPQYGGIGSGGPGTGYGQGQSQGYHPGSQLPAGMGVSQAPGGSGGGYNQAYDPSSPGGAGSNQGSSLNRDFSSSGYNSGPPPQNQPYYPGSQPQGYGGQSEQGSHGYGLPLAAGAAGLGAAGAAAHGHHQNSQQRDAQAPSPYGMQGGQGPYQGGSQGQQGPYQGEGQGQQGGGGGFPGGYGSSMSGNGSQGTGGQGGDQFVPNSSHSAPPQSSHAMSRADAGQPTPKLSGSYPGSMDGQSEGGHRYGLPLAAGAAGAAGAGLAAMGLGSKDRSDRSYDPNQPQGYGSGGAPGYQNSTPGNYPGNNSSSSMPNNFDSGNQASSLQGYPTGAASRPPPDATAPPSAGVPGRSSEQEGGGVGSALGAGAAGAGAGLVASKLGMGSGPGTGSGYEEGTAQNRDLQAPSSTYGGTPPGQTVPTVNSRSMGTESGLPSQAQSGQQGGPTGGGGILGKVGAAGAAVGIPGAAALAAKNGADNNDSSAPGSTTMGTTGAGVPATGSAPAASPWESVEKDRTNELGKDQPTAGEGDSIYEPNQGDKIGTGGAGVPTTSKVGDSGAMSTKAPKKKSKFLCCGGSQPAPRDEY